MYRNIGYYVENQVQVLLPAARRLIAKHGNQLDLVLSTSFREAGISDRFFMADLTRDDYIQLGKSTAFPLGSAEYRALLHLVYAITNASGWGDYRPSVIKYTESPALPLDEMVTNALGEHLEKGLADVKHMWPEKCKVETFRTHLATVIKKMALLWHHRPYIIDKLERYIGDILYRMKLMEISPTALDQWDRSLLACVVHQRIKDANGRLIYREYTDDNGAMQELNIRSQRDDNTLIAPEIARLKNVCQPGPWLRYTRLMSNKDQRELMALLCPVLPDLPLATGYLMPVGPFHEVELSVHQRLTWGDDTQFQQVCENVVFPPLSESQTRRQLGFRTPAIVNNSPHVNQVLDWPTLEVVNDTDEHNSNVLRYSWYSPTMQRMVHDVNGNSINTLILDLAATHERLGETPVPMTNIHEIKWADLSQLPDSRRIITRADSSTSDEPEDSPVLRTRVYEDIWYFEGGRVLKKKQAVDVTPMYHRLGNVSYRPAFSQYFLPARKWFLEADTNAVEFIIAKLGLNVYDAARSKLAIAISHNVAMYKRITGRTDDPFDVEEVIKGMHGMPTK